MGYSIRKICTAISLLAVFSVPTITNAVIVNYVIEGDLQLTSGSDLLSLDGARYVWTITADTNSAMEYSSYLPDGIAAFYQSLGSSFNFTNRSNGASDATVSGTAPRIWTGNRLATSSAYDLFEINHSYLSGEFTGLTVTTYWLGFSPDFYDDGIAALPSSFNFNDALVGGWGRFSFSDEISEIARYEPTNWSITVSTVPIPPAVWLFGSGLIGLIGLIGLAKRKKTNN